MDPFVVTQAAVAHRFEVATANQPPVLFVSSEGLFEAYLDGFSDPVQRQHHNCRECRSFIERFGSLVTVSEFGNVFSAVWPTGVSSLYSRPFANMLRLVQNRPVQGMFASPFGTLGRPTTNGWDHWYLTNRKYLMPPSEKYSAEQIMARKAANFDTLKRALGLYNMEALSKTRAILVKSKYPNRYTTWIEWLIDIHGHTRRLPDDTSAANWLWTKVATAPAGWCSPRGSTLGKLIEDVIAEKPESVCLHSFHEKMDPLVHQRPQAPAKAGNINAAETLVNRLGIRDSFARRRATMADIPPSEVLWTRSIVPHSDRARMFGQLQNARAAAVPGGRINWSLLKAMLPDISDIQVVLNLSSYPFNAFCSAVHKDAPPIIKWDHPEQRNPVTWYTYVDQYHLTPRSWGLRGEAAEVSAIIPFPDMWGGNTIRVYGEQYLLAIRGCGDARSPGSALFPDFLKSDLHEIRATVEEYSRSSPLGTVISPIAGVKLSANGCDIRLRITIDGKIYNTILSYE